jgi:hypothetical protein
MGATEAMICWNPGTAEIAVVPWPDAARRSAGLRMSAGACDMEFHEMPPDQRLALLFIHFNTIVVRDRVPAEAAHRAFLAIDEYRRHISPDMAGAEQD